MILGCLTYIAFGTMMEVKNAIRMIAPFANEPTPLLWDILLQIVRYVTGAKTNSVKYYYKIQAENDNIKLRIQMQAML